MADAHHEFQKLFEETRNGRKLPGGLISSLVPAMVATDLDPAQALTFMQDPSFFEALADLKDGEGDYFIAPEYRDNLKMWKSVLGGWSAKEVNQGEGDGYVTLVKKKNSGIDSAPGEEGEDEKSESDSDSGSGVQTRSQAKNEMKIAAGKQGITVTQAVALSIGLISGKISPVTGAKKDLFIRSDPRLSESMKTYRKMGARTLEKVLKEDDLSGLRSYFNDLAESAEGANMPKLAISILRWFNCTSELFLSALPTESEVKQLKEYIKKYIDRYYGLGLPEPIDLELHARCLRRIAQGSGPSVEELKTIREESKAVAKVNSQLSKELGDLRESLKALKEKMGKSPAKDPKCFICGGPHLARDCPEKRITPSKTDQDKEDKE